MPYAFIDLLIYIRMVHSEVHIRTHYKMYVDNHKIAICGNIEELGLWDPDECIIAVEYPSDSGKFVQHLLAMYGTRDCNGYNMKFIQSNATGAAPPVKKWRRTLTCLHRSR